jgi:hypothetical protein
LDGRDLSIDFLVKFFGGYTKLEYDNLNASIESWRARSIAAETTVELFKEIVTRERERSDKIERDIMERAGTIKPPEMKPVGNSVSSWPRIRRELEKQNRVKDAEVSRAEIEKTIRGQE